MHLTTLINTTFLLISLTIASFFDTHQHLHGRHLTLEQKTQQKARRDARSLMNHELYHFRRHASPQSPGPSSVPATSPTVINGTNPNFDRGVWNTSVMTACTSSLSTFTNGARNPTGMAACYNIPFLDNTTGVFEADLRLYHIADPSGEFAGVEPSGFNIAVSWLAAQASSNQKLNATAPMIAAYDFVGMINQPVIKKAPLNDTQLEALLTPQIQISALNSKGVLMNTTIDASTVSFVAGKFAGQANTNTSANAAQASAIAQAAQAFVLPGTTLGIFPIGLIVTSAWTAVFIGVVGWGTIGRIRFRGHYRRRVARANGVSFAVWKKAAW